MKKKVFLLKNPNLFHQIQGYKVVFPNECIVSRYREWLIHLYGRGEEEFYAFAGHCVDFTAEVIG